MAQLQIEPDLLAPGRWTVRSDHPSALAAVSDAIVQSLGLQEDALGVWALHYDEQDLHAEDAYARERGELGFQANSQVVVLPTPHAHNVVYLDRLHLVAVSGSPAAGSRVAGLYVDTVRRDQQRGGGDVLLVVHEPAATPQIAAQLGQLPHDRSLREGHQLVANSRFVLRVDREQPLTVRVAAPQPLALPVQDALGRLRDLVAGW
jgi:hypothetical protein